MDVREVEITLENGMKIQGELDLPRGTGPWKTVILLHGSGASDRHATVETRGKVVSRNFDLLSSRFVQAGMRYFVMTKEKVTRSA